MLDLLLFDIPNFGDANIWLSILTLTFLEIVLGVDNIIFITLEANKLEEKDRKKATNIGLLLAMVLRVGLLFGISWLISLEDCFRTFIIFGKEVCLTGQGLILVGGGLFLLYKSVSEIHHKVEGDQDGEGAGGKAKSTMTRAIVQITLINIVFSMDSILTAVGMTSGLYGALLIMIIGVVLSIIVMMLFAAPVGKFVNEHPTIQILGLSFLILISFLLITEGAHKMHLVEAAVPKGYLYFAIAFSLVVEFLNMKVRKK